MRTKKAYYKSKYKSTTKATGKKPVEKKAPVKKSSTKESTKNSVKKLTDAEMKFHRCLMSLYGKEWLYDKHDALLPVLAVPDSQKRLYRYDFVWSDVRVCVEVQGGLYQDKSGHNTANGIMRDIEKLSYAVQNNYVLVQIPGHFSIRAMSKYVKIVVEKVAELRNHPKPLPGIHHSQNCIDTKNAETIETSFKSKQELIDDKKISDEIW